MCFGVRRRVGGQAGHLLGKGVDGGTDRPAVWRALPVHPQLLGMLLEPRALLLELLEMDLQLLEMDLQLLEMHPQKRQKMLAEREMPLPQRQKVPTRREMHLQDRQKVLARWEIHLQELPKRRAESGRALPTARQASARWRFSF